MANLTEVGQVREEGAFHSSPEVDGMAKNNLIDIYNVMNMT